MSDRTKTLRREGEMASVIYDRFRTDILTGRLAPGVPLSQLTIAREYGISRGPVREAMSRLEYDQLIIGRAHRRFVVAPFDIADLETVLSLHLANMALAVRASVPKLTDRDIAALGHACARMETTVEVDHEAWENAYRDFALKLISHAGERAVVFVSVLLDNLQRYRAHLLDRFPRVYAGGKELREIIEAARAYDGARAGSLYVEYMGRISSLILAGAAPLYDAARLRTYITALTPDAESVRRTLGAGIAADGRSSAPAARSRP